MPAADRGPRTVGLNSRLREARRRRFVGRASELELFRGALAAPEESFAVLYLYGPGGVGKTALLDELADASRAAGARPVTVDARTIQPTPSAFLTSLAPDPAVPANEPPGPVADLFTDGRYVLLIDTYEQLAPLDDWLRERFLPELPAHTLVVIACRNPPAPRWTSDLGWRDLLRVVSLRNLRPEDTQDYLRTEGVPGTAYDAVLDVTHGHPLTLTLLVDVIARQHAAGAPVPTALTEAPDVVRALLARVVDAAPTARHRQALEVCAHARFTTEDLLRVALGGTDGHELFGWLRTQSFIEEGRRGVYPHDVARDALDADLHWRDPQGYAELHRLLRSHAISRIREVAADELEKQQRGADLLFLGRDHPIIRGYLEVAAVAQVRVEALRPDDHTRVIAVTRERQGERQADHVAYWLDRQPAAFRAFRSGDDEFVGFQGYLALHESEQEDLAHDPGARAMWDYVERHGPPRPGESVIAQRFFVDMSPAADGERRATAVETVARLWYAQDAITRGGGAWDLISVDADRSHWEPMFRHFDFHLAAEARYEIGGMAYDVYAHDWRRRDIESWLELTGERDLGAPVAASSDAPPDVVLSQPEFAGAVRTALRDLHHADRLAGNALVRSRVVRDHIGESTATSTLRTMIERAADSLRDDPREESLHRVIDRTFLRPAPTQERAAEQLGLPFSTYRRHRDRGVERIISWLWQRELYGDAI